MNHYLKACLNAKDKTLEKMNNTEKILQLRKLIYSQLLPIIGKKCILLDAPYYHNIGDVLIWTGEECFFKDNGIECLYTASYETCRFPKFDRDVTVVFNGGGNLGDIYREHMDFLLEVLKHYPENRIVVCPQTVYYQDATFFKKDFSIIKRHADLFFCARDKTVFDMLEPILGDRVMLLPDMAFYVEEDMLSSYKKETTRDKLIIRRDDVEVKNGAQLDLDGDVHDWPVFEHSFRRSTFLNKIFKKISDAKIPLITNVSNRLWDSFAITFRKLMIREGVNFISPYKVVESTRLHGCILSILLCKEVILCDNSYGKNLHFYDTWLNDLESVIIKKS